MKQLFNSALPATFSFYRKGRFGNMFQIVNLTLLPNISGGNLKYHFKNIIRFKTKRFRLNFYIDLNLPYFNFCDQLGMFILNKRKLVIK